MSALLRANRTRRYYAGTGLAPEGLHENSPGQASETSAVLGN
jgi:hypothetical protein